MASGLALRCFIFFVPIICEYSASILRIKTSAIQTVTMLTSLLGLVIAVDAGHLEINSLSGAGWAFFLPFAMPVLYFIGHTAHHTSESISHLPR